MIPIVARSGADPWNHVEAAIALDLNGYHAAALAAYGWLATTQRRDGSWFATYDPSGHRDALYVDTNAVGYLATGLLLHHLVTDGADVAGELFFVMARALDFVTTLERGLGRIPWSIEPAGAPARASLLAASSSLVSSLRHGALLATELGLESIQWMLAADRIAARVREPHEAFMDKSEFAMDWYYPVLAGVLEGRQAIEHYDAQRAVFVTENGVLCRSDRRWVTSAETAEASIAAARLGDLATAEELFMTLGDKRLTSGGYRTGLVYPERSEFPPGEETSYSAAAVLIAADVLAGGVAATLFGVGADAGHGIVQRETSTRRLPVRSVLSSTNRPEESASL